MGSLLHPIGPEQTRVYWVRRTIVLLALFVVVVALVMLGVWAWPKPAVVVAVPSPSTTAPPTTAPPATPATAGSPTPATAPPTPTTPAACEAASVRLSIAGFEKVKLSGKQAFVVSAVNSGSEACVLTINPVTYSLTVVSGKDKIWTTAHCEKWLPAKKLTLKPRAAYEFTITWPLVRSKSGCKTTDNLKPGTYIATATYQTTATARQVMQLVA